jgi:hypothetical protein
VRRIWWFIKFEAGLVRSVYLLLTGQRDGAGPGVVTVGYHKGSTPLWVIGLIASAVEIPVLHLIVPWRTVQLALLVLGAWGLWFVAGLWASYAVRPYLVDAAGVRLRHGPFADRRIPWSQIADVRPLTTRTWDGTGLGCAVAEQDGKLAYLTHSETTVALVLDPPLGGITEVHVGADDADALLRALLSRRPSAPADRG